MVKYSLPFSPQAPLKKDTIMAMFLGEYNPNITEGSRIALPKKLRKYIKGDEVVLAKGFDKCVFVYDKKDWVNLIQKRVEKERNGVSTEELERYLFTSASESSVDAQGRIVIPSNLVDFAEIEKKTAILGVGDHIELWSDENWKSYSQRVAAKLGA